MWSTAWVCISRKFPDAAAGPGTPLADLLQTNEHREGWDENDRWWLWIPVDGTGQRGRAFALDLELAVMRILSWKFVKWKVKFRVLEYKNFPTTMRPWGLQSTFCDPRTVLRTSYGCSTHFTEEETKVSCAQVRTRREIQAVRLRASTPLAL